MRLRIFSNKAAPEQPLRKAAATREKHAEPVGGGEAALTDKIIFLASLCSRAQSSDNDILSANYIRFRTVDRITQTLDATMTPL